VEDLSASSSSQSPSPNPQSPIIEYYGAGDAVFAVTPEKVKQFL
jgi:hypothetical protein